MLPAVSLSVRPGASAIDAFSKCPAASSFHIKPRPCVFMNPITMESQPAIGNPAIVQLCDTVLETLRVYLNAANDIKVFSGEVRTLRKFLDLIDRVFKARLQRMPFEEQHLTCVEVLLDRCRTTLSRLSKALLGSRSNDREIGSPEGLREVLSIMQGSEVIALRARISFFTQTLQMSLQTLKL